MSKSAQVVCGLQYHNVHDIYDTLKDATQNGFSFIVSPIVHPRFRREFLSGKSRNRKGAFTRSDLVLSTQDWANSVVAQTSAWLDLDSCSETTRKNSQKGLEQELNFVAHLNLRAVLIPLRGPDCTNLARFVFSKAVKPSSQSGYQVWVYVPMRAHQDENRVFFNDAVTNDDSCLTKSPSNGTWEWWNKFRTICSTDSKIGLALELSADLPSIDEIWRWLGEPVCCVFVKTSLFSTNSKGFPVLSQAHQNILKTMWKLDILVVIYGSNRHGSRRLYHRYLNHLWSTRDSDKPVLNITTGLKDSTQSPEQSPEGNSQYLTNKEIKQNSADCFDDYEEAIYRALLDRVSDEDVDKTTVIIVVIGAGKGILVRSVLNAAIDAKRLVKVYAIERNQSAIVNLSVQQEVWGERVTIVPSDVRDFHPVEKVDILVSKLLGSFADNKLLPEYFDAAQKFLKDDGICIPCSYMSFLVPVSAPKLYSDIALKRERDKHPLTHFEMPRSMEVFNHTPVSSPKPLFTFNHPKREDSDNSQYRPVHFEIQKNYSIHGFTGSYEIVLYENIKLGGNASTNSQGILSWFPIFFPLKDPIYLSSGTKLEVNFWRCVSPHHVWYEWAVTGPTVGNIHNPCGRSHTIKL